MSKRREERCCACDAPTGRAGQGEDSLYLDFPDGAHFGPLCEECYDAQVPYTGASRNEVKGG